MLHSRLNEKQDARLKYVEITVCLVSIPEDIPGLILICVLSAVVTLTHSMPSSGKRKIRYLMHDMITLLYFILYLTDCISGSTQK